MKFEYLGTKGRNRLLRFKQPLILSFGKLVCLVNHLQYLIYEVPKTEHGITKGDIKAEDRMKFEHVRKLTSLRVINCLENLVDYNVYNAKGTAFYLKMLKNILDSFLLAIYGKVLFSA